VASLDEYVSDWNQGMQAYCTGRLTDCVCGISQQKYTTLIPTALWRELVNGIYLPLITLVDDVLDSIDSAFGIGLHHLPSYYFLIFSNRIMLRHLPYMRKEDILTSRLVVIVINVPPVALNAAVSRKAASPFASVIGEDADPLIWFAAPSAQPMATPRPEYSFFLVGSTLRVRAAELMPSQPKRMSHSIFDRSSNSSCTWSLASEVSVTRFPHSM
jgi:hypothetical protein